MTIRRRLELAVASIALLALATAFANYLQLRRLEGDARAINLVGSQRMRSYRLATLASHHAAYRDLESAASIDEELDRFRSTLLALRDGDPARGLKPAPDEEAVAALDAAAELFLLFEARLRDLVRAVDAPRAEGGGMAGAGAGAGLEVQAIVAMATSLAERMDAATTAFERASAGSVRRYRNVQLALFWAAAAVAIVAFEVVRRSILAGLPVLEDGLHALARGHLGATVPDGGGRDEIARVAQAFNETSRELERARTLVLAHEAELARRNEELQRADQMKSQFVATMSHELRTPLTSVIGFSDLLLRGVYGPVSEQQRDRVGSILRNARHLLTLIGDVLDLSKIEAGKMEVRIERLDPGRLVADLADLFRPLAAAKGVAFEVAVPGDLPVVESDPAHIRQILYNLVSNAVKFTDAGSVRVSVAPAAEAGSVRVEVADTGAGIAPADLGRLFGRFVQLDGSATRKHGGTGLGLHISKRFAELLGARIEVESEPGRGSRFALVIPPRPGGTVPAATGSSVTDPRGQEVEHVGRQVGQ